MDVESRFGAGKTTRYISVIPVRLPLLLTSSCILNPVPGCALFDGGPVLDYLKTVKAFLDAHPSEVLTLLFTNPEQQGVGDVWKPIFDESGLSPMAYTPPHVPLAYNGWPTLDEMITTGKRLVVFMDFGANVSQVPFILPEFEMIWETPFGFTNSSFPCSIDRISDSLPTEDHMYMINHSLNRNWTFLTSPLGLIGVDGPEIIVSDPGDAEVTNGVGSILANVARCAPLAQDRNPNFVLLDFVDKGEAFKAGEILNGLQPYPTPAATPSPSATSNSGSASGWKSGFMGISMGSVIAIGVGAGAVLVI
ncbi:hypothetical protein V5O48_003590 [Marasmius crinis-equi]|uniref:Uncharacterized protein n=1 Tax=Marasmius crinis-equi TaxID=585013 RepID=A0ABR3FSF8_9AGAR